MQNYDVNAWGKSVLEEVLLQAALAVPDSTQPLKEAEYAMSFRISADVAAGQLVVRCARIGGEDITLRVDIPEREEP